jgi:hypothetical protein
MADLVAYELFPRSSLMTARTGREWTGSEHALSTGCAHSLVLSVVKSGRSKSPSAALSMLSNDRNTHVWLTSVESRAISSSLMLSSPSCGSRFLTSKLLRGYYAPSCPGILHSFAYRTKLCATLLIKLVGRYMWPMR